MKVLWVVRLARSDFLRAVNFIATKVAKWTSRCDIMLNRLMAYILSTKHRRMCGWVGDVREKVFPHLFADAGFARDIDPQRSTSGFHSVIRGANMSCPICAGSKRQTCVSHSTPEADLVAADFSLRTDGLLALSSWRARLPDKPP